MYKKNAGRKDIKNPGGAIPNSVIFWTHRAPKRDIRDPNTLTLLELFIDDIIIYDSHRQSQ
jgi:hypothetical protein